MKVKLLLSRIGTELCIHLRAIQKCQHFISVQTVHFFRPPPHSPPSVQTNIFGLWVSHSVTLILQQQKVTLLSSLFDM